MLTAAAELDEHSRTNRADLRLSPPHSTPPISNYSQQMLSPVCFGPSVPRMADATEDRNAGPTSSRTLNGITVTGEEIDEIFQLYVYDTPPLKLSSNMRTKIFQPLCPIPPNRRSPNIPKHIIRSVAIPILGHNWRRM